VGCEPYGESGRQTCRAEEAPPKSWIKTCNKTCNKTCRMEGAMDKIKEKIFEAFFDVLIVTLICVHLFSGKPAFDTKPAAPSPATVILNAS
jgi:hypothetical protein